MLGIVRNSQKVKSLYWLHCIAFVRNTLDQFLQSSCCLFFKIKSYFANFGSMRICFMTNNHLVPEWYSLSFLRIGSGVHQWCAYRQQCHIVQRFILCVFGQQRYTVQGDKEHCARFEHLFGNDLQSLIKLLPLYCLFIAFVLGYWFSVFFIFFIRTGMLS